MDDLSVRQHLFRAIYDLSVSSGGISVKLGTNIHYLSGRC